MLIKNAETLEKTKDIDVIVFDKTGTITNGKPNITNIITYWIQESELFDISKSLAKLSNHPLSKCISNNLKWKILDIQDFEEIKWKWIIWKIKGTLYKLWNKKLFKEELFNKKIKLEIDKLSKDWKTPIIFWSEIEILWMIGLLDTKKAWANNLIKELYKMNIEVVMLTWDTKTTAEYIAKDLKIKNVIAEVMPEDKLNHIKRLQNWNQKVAFVWDWINDAPWLVQSDLWIAMWTWSDIAIESSDIVLVKWNLEKVVSSIELSRKTLSIIKQNLFWAFVYNSIWIPLAAFWILNPMFAAFAMSMSSVSVISNSLRLRKFK
jgi:Cu+-exporting ATPase